jgi:hypothetical protein
MANANVRMSFDLTEAIGVGVRKTNPRRLNQEFNKRNENRNTFAA